MNESGCLNTIRSRLDTWSAKERRVASYILENPGDAVNPSIEVLAEKIGVSESTLFRFVRKLGYGGYQQFRIALATETLTPRSTWYESPEAAIDEKSAVAIVFRTSIAALEATLAEGHCGELPAEMVPMMRNAKEASDAAMTDAMLRASAGGRPAWLIAGNGYPRERRGSVGSSPAWPRT